MSNKKIIKRKVNREQFLKTLSDKGYSIRSYGLDGSVNERTIRRILGEGYGTITVLYAIAEDLDVTLDELCGPDDREEWWYFKHRVCQVEPEFGERTYHG